uniref:Protein HGH1 homolog n=1 Tax=Cacopsylla melanoneura TaxID=428564 RepID=A0A8D8XWV9_9HEMI
MDTLEELKQFLEPKTRPDVKLIAVQHILGLTASPDTCNDLTNAKQIDLVNAIIGLLTDLFDEVVTIALNILLNLSAEKGSAKNILCNSSPSIISVLFNHIVNSESPLADNCCKILNNLTSSQFLAAQTLESIQNECLNLDQLVSCFVIQNYNKQKCNLNYLAKVFGNLTQISDFRQYVLDKDKCTIQRLIPFTEYAESSVRREGIAALIKNCCFDTESHAWLLGDTVDLLPKLLLPLAGGEEFDDEDNEKLPIECQYLSSDKKREPNAQIRKILLETLLQLCSVKQNRMFIRDKNTYLILRELHKTENDKEVLLACENVVDILIRTEDEIGVDELKTVEVPEDMTEKFNNMDEEFLKSS